MARDAEGATATAMAPVAKTKEEGGLGDDAGPRSCVVACVVVNFVTPKRGDAGDPLTLRFIVDTGTGKGGAFHVLSARSACFPRPGCAR